jgi:hypothetical protein
VPWKIPVLDGQTPDTYTTLTLGRSTLSRRIVASETSSEPGEDFVS